MAIRAILFVALLAGLVSAQETALCSRTGDRMTFWKQTNELKCGVAINFPSFKVMEDADGLSVVAVNIASIEKTPETNCNFYVPSPEGYKSLRDGSAVQGLTWVPEDQPSEDGSKFTGPINNDHKKFGTVVMNGCSMIIQRVGTDYYISHPLNGFSIKREVMGSDGGVPVVGGVRAVGNKANKRVIITPIPMFFNKDGSKNDNLFRNTHAVGEWQNGNLIIYMGQFRNDLAALGKDKTFKTLMNEGYIKTTNGPNLLKLEKSKVPLVYDNCYKITISTTPSVDAEDAPPTNLYRRPQAPRQAQEGQRRAQQGARNQAPRQEGNPNFLQLRSRLSERKRF